MKVRDDFEGVIHLPIEGLVLRAGDDIPEGVQVGDHVTGQDSTESEEPKESVESAEPEGEPGDEADDEEPVDGKPRGNASTEAWHEYAKSQGASDEDLTGLTRDEIRDLYSN